MCPGITALANGTGWKRKQLVLLGDLLRAVKLFQQLTIKVPAVNLIGMSLSRCAHDPLTIASKGTAAPVLRVDLVLEFPVRLLVQHGGSLWALWAAGAGVAIGITPKG